MGIDRPWRPSQPSTLNRVGELGGWFPSKDFPLEPFFPFQPSLPAFTGSSNLASFAKK